jgi:tetratricopeptide (TPR) repeat protein
MRRLLARTLNLLMRFRFGRWLVTLVFLGTGLLLVLAPASPGTDTTTVIGSGIVVLLIGLVLLYLTIRLEVLLRKNKQLRQASVDRAKQLIDNGKLLAIPPLPQTPPKGASADDLMNVERQALKMADLPWGEHPRIASVEEAYPLFNQTVGRVRAVTGDWSALSEPIGIFARLPKPLCFIGAAEVMHPLSYLRGDLWAPIGLRQGLRFIARAQYHDPEQPDALMIRAKLLTGYNSDLWLRLAEETLEIARRVAPQHPRLPDAEASLLIRRGKLEEALACIEASLANPPTQEEIHVALTRKARLLDRMKRYEEALATYDLVNERYPQDPWTWHNKSLLLLNLGRYQEALACNERALSIMDFNVARTTGERIRAKMAEAQNASS